MSKVKTPLRYPGGKQKLTPFIVEILEENDLFGGHYVEPYAGGAGVAIELLLNDYVSHIYLNDISEPVYAFWYSMLNNTEKFCKDISRIPLDIDEWRKQKNIFKTERKNLYSLGFATFYLNRCNRSGILSGGAIGGIEQQGEWKIDARFQRNDLIGRIEAIASRKDQISLTNLDAEYFITHNIPSLPKKTLVYCDPPYFKKADSLYQNHYTPEDHLRISKVIQKKIKRPWVVSYDADPNILSYYEKCEVFVYSLQYNAAKAYKGTEVFAFSDKLRIPLASTLSFINEALQTIH